MSNLIIFAGLPGAGKTTLARKLSIKLNYFYLRVDCIEAPFSTYCPKAGENGEGYVDEENRSRLLTIRQTYALEADKLAEQGRKEEAREILKKSESLIKPADLPYAMVSSNNNMHNRISLLYLQAAYKANDFDLARKLDLALRKDTNDQKNYYAYVRTHREDKYGAFVADDQICDQLLNIMDQLKKQYVPAPTVKETPGEFRK